MSEKRFVLEGYLGVGDVVIDTWNRSVRFSHAHELSMKQCCDLLNDLFDENLQLKKLLQEAEEEINKLKKSNTLLMESIVEKE